jgi:hypothetical protein
VLLLLLLLLLLEKPLLHLPSFRQVHSICWML